MNFYRKKRNVVDTVAPPEMRKANPCPMTSVPNPLSAQTTPREVNKSLLMQQTQLDFVGAMLGHLIR